MLQISQLDFDGLRAHAEEAYPQECCGVLLGRVEAGTRIVSGVVRCANVHPSPATHYTIDPHELIRLQGEARERGVEILGFYHSHPEHTAKPSARDLAEAYWTGGSYVITAVEGGRATLTGAFVLTGTEEQKRFENEEIVVAPIEPFTD